ncbi:dihydrodipicolinate synthase family protein [Bosea sp. (in: a-proteobacteria)]|uniref:dihydrodipicolinate synthase family protein n=1 Tax=Bosea sp. (in: a-proteobacteria) TaxID=1871050 RepID=UPI0012187D06|nr:dihydrodipicolinate synthase family protein [Bosea sp. (in: a-proteobacteria)]TAJ30070.1 MAG: dihydrodipicolinate synthase family protein [Bosea sp. (in: a-proteobacteria)]
MTVDASIFRGLSAFPLTPADADGVVDTDAFAVMIDRLVSAGVDSIAVLGSTGTYAYLDRSERSRALACAVETVAGRVPLIAGIGATRTSWVKEPARDAERRGADGLLLAPVSYALLTQDEVFTHFDATAAATGLPICIYNNPSTTHFSFSLDLVSRLSQVPRIAAIKMPLPADGDFSREIGQLRSSCREGLIVGYSGDWGAAPALLAGADAWYSVVAGLLPVAALRLTRAALSGDREAATAANAGFGPLWTLFQAHGSLRVMYLIADQLGLRSGQPPLPVQPLADSVLLAVAEAMEAITR